jgi:hypothetical protein
MRLDEIAQQPAFDKQAILEELAKLKIESTSTINADGSVDVNGNVKIPKACKHIPVQFRNVSGHFMCNNTRITSLQGVPQQVGSDFFCHGTQITSLQYAPQSVGGDFNCDNTKITSLQYAPQQVGGFYCFNTKITSLQYAPQHVGGNFYCHNTKITSLRYAPQQVGGDFWCNDTQIESLHNIYKTHSDWVIGGRLVIPNNCTHLLGLAYLEGVKQVRLGWTTPNFTDVIHDVFEWQEKLLELGLVEQAQL